MRFARITVDPRQMGGVPCVGGLRISMATVVGMAEAEILSAYPDLEPEDIREALRYAAEAVRETRAAARYTASLTQIAELSKLSA